MHFDNIQTIKEAVILGSGVSIIPRRILQAELAEGRLRAVPLSEPGLYATSRNCASEEEAIPPRCTGVPRLTAGGAVAFNKRSRTGDRLTAIFLPI